MNKEEVFNLLKTKGGFYCQEKQFIKKFPDIYDDICRIDFPEDFSFSQKLYHYFNNDPDLKLGICPVCGNRCPFYGFNKAYSNWCSAKCRMKDENIKAKIKQTCLEKYGEECFTKTNMFKKIIKSKYENMSDEDKYQIYNIKRKQTCLEKYGVEYYTQTSNFIKVRKQTCLEKYGVEYYSQTKEYKESYKNTMIQHYGVEHPLQSKEIMNKTINTCLKKYGVKNYSSTKECKNKVKQTNIKKYGSEYYQLSNDWKNKINEINQKIYITKKQNHTINSSSIEQKIENYFIENKFNYIHQYKSIEYPFSCDFYLPDYNLYIEIQGHFSHGKHPFNKYNEDDIKILNQWLNLSSIKPQYKSAINTWTIRDPHKRDVAKNNNLNYLEIFSTDFNICISGILNKIKELGY